MEIIESIEKEALAKTSYLADKLIQAYIYNDVEEMRLITPDKISINSQYISYKVNGNEIKYDIINGPST